MRIKRRFWKVHASLPLYDEASIEFADMFPALGLNKNRKLCTW